MAVTYTSMAQNAVNMAQAQAYAGANTGSTSSSSYSSGLNDLASIYSGLTSGSGQVLSTTDTGKTSPSLVDYLNPYTEKASIGGEIITGTLNALNSPSPSKSYDGGLSDSYHFNMSVLSGYYT